MKNLLAVITSVLILTSCDTRPTVAYSQPVVTQPVVTQPVVTQDYQVIQDPYSGARQVVYTMNGLQYVIAYATFMSWYNYGGYGYVNSMYSSHRTYFNNYNSNRYRGWKSSTFRNTYNGPSRTYTTNSSFGTPNNSNRVAPSSFGTPNRVQSNRVASSSFGTPNRVQSNRVASSSFGTPNRVQSNRVAPSSFGTPSRVQSTSSFGGSKSSFGGSKRH